MEYQHLIIDKLVEGIRDAHKREGDFTGWLEYLNELVAAVTGRDDVELVSLFMHLNGDSPIDELKCAVFDAAVSPAAVDREKIALALANRN